MPATEGGRSPGPTASKGFSEHGPAIRRATPSDLEAVLELERLCFQPWRRASRRSLARSLCSQRQSVWIIDAPHAPLRALPAQQDRASGAGKSHAQLGAGRGGSRGALAAFVIVWHHASKLRIYDLATRPDLQGQGLGRRLVRHVEGLAGSAGCASISLEADPTEPGLVQWYERQGFRVVARLAGFYARGRHAVRLVKDL